jgi:hypothetical protein
VKRSQGRKVIPFPKPYDAEAEEAEVKTFVAQFEADTFLRRQYLREYLESGRASIDSILQIQRESFDMLALLWAGLSPRRQEQMIEKLAPQWAEFCALQERNAARAKEYLKRYEERASGKAN